MDLLEAVPIQSSPNLSSTKNHDRIEPGELLDETWFFGNLLDGKPRMLRCYSDPCPSSEASDDDMFPGKSMEETFSSINRIPEGKRFLTRASKGLTKTHSMPPSVAIKQEPDPAERNNPKIQETLRNSLLRAPSLPSFAEKEEIQDEESDFSMGKLIRQASLNQSKVLPPRQTVKGVTRSCSSSTIPKQNLRKKSEPKSINTILGCDSGERKPRYVTNQAKTRKSHSSLDIEEVQGFKNLGLTLQDEAKVIRRAYPSEAWLAKSFGPPLQSGAASKKSAEDMKAQIKFWARAVASNVRQEC